MHRPGRSGPESSGHACVCTGNVNKAVYSGAGGKRDLCGMWRSFTEEAESELGFG